MNPQPESATSTGLGGVPSYDVYAPLRDFSIGSYDFYGILSFLDSAWNTISIISFLISAFFIFGTIYAMQRTSQIAAEHAEELRAAEKAFAARTRGGGENSRWNDVQTHIASDNPNDWRLAIIEADIMLEEALAERGLAGSTIGERLKSASPEQFRTLDDAWRAHRVRNEIAHAGADFVLTKRTALETINQFERVFVELGKV